MSNALLGWFSRSTTSGAVLVASGAIGAGMFSLPLAAANVDFSDVLMSLLLVWLMTLWVTILLARVNLNFEAGTSFDSLVKDTLGSGWRFANNLSVWFIFAILLYAYFTAGAGILQQSALSLGFQNAVPAPLLSVVFGFAVALLVWSGSRIVTTVCAALLLGMTLAFTLASIGLLPYVSSAGLKQELGLPWMQSGALLPYFVTAFACGGLVPSLVKHYQGDAQSVIGSIVSGTFITFLVYVLWLTLNLGILERAELSHIASSGGSVAQLSSALQSSTATSGLPLILKVFAHLAITTSFLGIALGLFDFIADRFGFDGGQLGRAKTALLTFLPPALLSVIAPEGFLHAIGYAGLAVLFSFFIVPCAMAYKRGMLNLALVGIIIVFVVITAGFKLLH